MSNKKEKYKFNLCKPEVVAGLTVIHYGNSVYKPRKLLPIKNQHWVKPKGGLWTSPIDSHYSWKDWCHAEQFRLCEELNSFTLKFKDKTKIIIIDSLKDLQNLPFMSQGSYAFEHYVDYETLKNDGFDAIWLTEKGQYATRFSQPSLYGWDCETVFIMNRKCCYELISRKVLIEKFIINSENSEEFERWL